MEAKYYLTADPIFYITVAMFALLTTAVPALLGQPRFMPIIQAICLTVFLSFALRKQQVKHAASLLGLWLVIQFATMTVLTWSFADHVEQAIIDGFGQRAALLSWRFAGAPLPGGVLTQPLSRALELLGVVLGSIATGGLVGNWFLMRAVNLTGFHTGSLLHVAHGPLSLLAALPFWTLVRIAGYASCVLLCAEPLLTGNWSPAYYWRHHHRLIIVSLLLLALGLVLELALPPLWKSVAI